jgi:hypothetical protein
MRQFQKGTYITLQTSMHDLHVGIIRAIWAGFYQCGLTRAGLTQMGPCWEAAALNHDGLAHMGTSWVAYGLSM